MLLSLSSLLILLLWFINRQLVTLVVVVCWYAEKRPTKQTAPGLTAVVANGK
jgi:hypothetical protein